MKNLFLYSLVAGGLAFGLSSCLKDDEHFTDFQNVGAVAEIPSSAFYGIEDNQGLPIQTAPVSYSFDVNIASPTPPSQDVTVTLAVDKASLDAYNTANGTTYQLLPTTLYQIANLSTTVKAGTRLAPVQLTFFSSLDKVPDPTAYNNAGYAIPLKITSASNNVVVSSNYGTKIIFVKIKNQYDGDYHSLGYFTHPVATSSRKIDRDKTLGTVDLTTVQTEFADLGGSGWLMQLRVNADNTVTIIPKGSTPATANQIGINKYDPASQTYTLNYQYPGSGGNRVITEMIKRQ